MTIQEIAIVLENRIRNLRDAKIMAMGNGDLELVCKLEVDLATTEGLLKNIKTLL